MASLAQELMIELASVNSSDALLGLGGGSPSGIVIGKVGELTRNVDEQEYDPQYVSVGPYHRISNAKLARDDDKVRSFNAILSAATPSVTVEVLLNELDFLEVRARSCYGHRFDMTSKEFVRMLLLDGCYILSRFGNVDVDARHGNNGDSRAPPVVAAGGIDRHEAVSVVRDVLYLAENQIPFFAVERIHQLVSSDGNVPAVAGIARYVQKLLRRQQYSVATPALVPPSTPANLLHLIHMHFKPTVLFPASRDMGTTAGKAVGRWRMATEYYFAGVKFKARAISTKGEVAARSILDVKPSGDGSTLEVPCINIDGDTWRLLRNLIALEQRNTETTGSHVTAYCIFISQIACTARDVDLLSRKGIIVHGHGNHGEVAGYFADLCKGVLFDANDPAHNYLRPVWQSLEKRFQSRLRRWAALLLQKYFSNPWLAVGVFAGAVGLVCTVVQAVCSVLSYKPGGAK